jgi:hypothetical protein
LRSLGIIEIIIILTQVVLFVIVVAIAIAVVIWFVKIRQPSKVGLKKCPYCAEMIKAEAKVCRFCHRELVD